MFEQYERTQIAELRPVTEMDIASYSNFGVIEAIVEKDENVVVSISREDSDNGSPKIGDMIARNPDNHRDQWLVAEQYFEKNFRDVTRSDNELSNNNSFIKNLSILIDKAKNWGKTRERALVITKLQEAKFWLIEEQQTTNIKI